MRLHYGTYDNDASIGGDETEHRRAARRIIEESGVGTEVLIGLQESLLQGGLIVPRLWGRLAGSAREAGLTVAVKRGEACVKSSARELGDRGATVAVKYGSHSHSLVLSSFIGDC